MKYFAVVLMICIAGALGAAVDEKLIGLKALGRVCIEETGVDKIKVDRLDNGDLDETDPKLSCWTACMLKKLAMMNEEGQVIEETINQKNVGQIPAETFKGIMTRCKSMSGSNICEKGKEVMKCFYDNQVFPKLWL